MYIVCWLKKKKCSHDPKLLFLNYNFLQNQFQSIRLSLPFSLLQKANKKRRRKTLFKVFFRTVFEVTYTSEKGGSALTIEILKLEGQCLQWYW
jgi:hypothetical protein